MANEKEIMRNVSDRLDEALAKMQAATASVDRLYEQGYITSTELSRVHAREATISDKLDELERIVRLAIN